MCNLRIAGLKVCSPREFLNTLKLILTNENEVQVYLSQNFMERTAVHV